MRCACNFANNLASGPSDVLAAPVSSEASELDRWDTNCLSEDRLMIPLTDATCDLKTDKMIQESGRSVHTPCQRRTRDAGQEKMRCSLTRTLRQ